MTSQTGCWGADSIDGVTVKKNEGSPMSLEKKKRKLCGMHTLNAEVVN
jgi:hypothetical protein